jgi:hypothetical protein
MALQVIGAGWGRTGTESLKKALEQLGFGKCYHMFELLKDGRRLEYWEQLIEEGKTDYDRLFAGFQSAVDFPASCFYREFMHYYPDAKVILTYRDPEKWYDSASKTVLRDLPWVVVPIVKFFGIFNKNLRYMPRIYQNVVKDYIMDGLFEGRRADREFMINLYNEWVEEVTRTVPAEKLLVFESKDGWEPLCAFLGVPVPTTDYPHGNDSEQFKKRIKVRNIVSEFSKK